MLLLLAQLLTSTMGTTILAVAMLMVVMFMSIGIWASRYTKVAPNQVLIISGRQYPHKDPDGKVRMRGFRIIKGGGTFVYPVIEKVDVLSLELLTINAQIPDVITSQGVAVTIDSVAQIKINGDEHSIITAAEYFLSKGADEIRNFAVQTLERHLRAILRKFPVEEISQNRDIFASQIQENADGDAAKVGLSIVSFTLRKIQVANPNELHSPHHS